LLCAIREGIFCVIVDADISAVERAAGLIGAGEVIAFPTETRYGLAADATNPEAVVRLLAIKGRPESAAIALLVADRAMLASLVGELPPVADALIRAHWPGPLTLVLPARDDLPQAICSAGGRVGVRMSSDPVAAALVARCGHPITATSANRSGEEAAKTAREAALRGVALTLDGGPRDRLPSTVALIDAAGVRVLRRGSVVL